LVHLFQVKQGGAVEEQVAAKCEQNEGKETREHRWGRLGEE